jgi:hypothetical protein
MCAYMYICLSGKHFWRHFLFKRDRLVQFSTYTEYPKDKFGLTQIYVHLSKGPKALCIIKNPSISVNIKDENLRTGLWINLILKVLKYLTVIAVCVAYY